MNKILFLFFFISLISCQKTIKNDLSLLDWNSIRISQLSMDFQHEFGSSREYHEAIDNCVNNDFSILDCLNEWNDFFGMEKWEDKLAFKKDFPFLISHKDYWHYFSDYHYPFAFYDFNILYDINNDGINDRLIYYSYLLHESGTLVSSINNSFDGVNRAEELRYFWQTYSGFAFVTKHKKKKLLYLIKVKTLPEKLLNNKKVMMYYENYNKLPTQ